MCETELFVFFSCSDMSNSATPWTAAFEASLLFAVSKTLLILMFVESRDSIMSSQLNFCCPLLLLPSVFPISELIMFHEKAEPQSFPMSTLAKVLEFSFSISPSYEYLVSVSFGIDWVDLLTIQGLSRITFSKTVPKPQFFSTQLFYSRSIISLHWLNSVQFICSLSHV